MSFSIKVLKLCLGERAFGNAASICDRNVSVNVPVATEAVYDIPNGRMAKVFPVQVPGPIAGT
jgi:hypothetical protein